MCLEYGLYHLCCKKKKTFQREHCFTHLAIIAAVGRHAHRDSLFAVKQIRGQSECLAARRLQHHQQRQHQRQWQLDGQHSGTVTTPAVGGTLARSRGGRRPHSRLVGGRWTGAPVTSKLAVRPRLSDFCSRSLSGWRIVEGESRHTCRTRHKELAHVAGDRPSINTCPEMMLMITRYRSTPKNGVEI